MQDITTIWNEFTQWFSSQVTLFQTQPSEVGREFMSSLWDLSIWLNAGNKGLTIALILLVIIVNRILKRQH